MYKIGDKVQVVSSKSDHRFQIGEELTIFRIMTNGYDACNDTGDCCYITEEEIKLIYMIKAGDKVTLRKDSQWADMGTNNPTRVVGTVINVETERKTGECLIDLNITVDWGEGRSEEYNKIDLDIVKQTVKQTKTSMKLMKAAVKETAKRLAKANNTVTTLEIKTELRKTHPYFHWIQKEKNGLVGVSNFMEELANEGHFTYTDNGTFRTYSIPVLTVKPVVKRVSKGAKRTTPKINRTKALEMITNNKGHFFTAVFTKKDGEERTINCQYVKGQTPSPLGYIMVKEAGKMKSGVNPVRQINLQTLSNLRIGGQNYSIK